MLQARGVAAGPVMDGRDALNDEHLRQRGIFRRMTQVDCGERDWVGPFFRDDEGPAPMHRPPVAMGEDNDYIYNLCSATPTGLRGAVVAGHIGDRFDDSIP